MIRHLAGLVTSAAALVAGGWLLLAPFALGHEGDPRTIDLATGAGVCLIALVTAAAWAASWRARLRDDGVLAPRRPPAAPEHPAVPSVEELHALLKPLVAALAADQAGQGEVRA
ncbi:hypothetical protein FH608_018005 [Nonomuraea phyllanthi]|uniref:Uncharacterized protein n=1 Tax=Nonomuraea phyllanthi TaxID=2219224 RepID=A0A5C4WK98_9ACTN|nr:hypothetical protein [Nonomuraea phyllanthi]KAB8194076.1 hypothetical protein FH608_018005 [Nonomuraea phyllanthi]QFY07678.1 hypothetical protein GBF35_14170 [Nonomuraea phyllanthi]